jgi:dTDP-4-dehydrorhamnose 3,5-epimerase-like enzyme
VSIDDCRLIDLPRFADPRGNLSFVEGGLHIPFDIARVYYIWGIPDGAVRGAHGHRALQQFLIATSGEFDVVVDDGKERKTFRLNRPDQGLYVCPMIWRDVTNFSDGAVCLALASLPFDEADYYRDYDVFLRDAQSGDRS